jgi:hypothetical protein
MRVLFLVLLLVGASCSSSSQIASSSNEIVSTAHSSKGRFVWIADETDKPSPNIPGIKAHAVAGAAEQDTIIQNAAKIIYNLPGVKDITPFWAELLVWGLIAIAVVGVVVIAMQTGFPSLIGRFIVRWFPKTRGDSA